MSNKNKQNQNQNSQEPQKVTPTPPEQKQEVPEVQEIPETPEPIQKEPELPKASKGKKLVDEDDYKKYTDYKFIQFAGGELREEVEAEMNKLEASIKKCSGKVSRRTVTAALGSTIARLVKGIPVPKSIDKLIPGKDKGIYFE